MVARPCCGGAVCWGCLHRQVNSVVADAERTRLRCPLCPVAMTDADVRAILRHGNAYGLFYKSHRKEIAHWERWSVRVGLAGRHDAHLDDVVACPGLECENLWLVPAALRRKKSAREPERSISLRRLLYRPPKAGDGDEGDPRRIFCGRCDVSYCGLCRRPWRQAVRGFRGRGRRVRPPTESHDGKSCVAFAHAWTLRADDDFASVAAAAGAKACPGCSLRVARTAGCNHMECPTCGMHWCFVCETRFSAQHYACRDDAGETYKRDPEACAVS